jgi:hypothetical protein
MEMLQAAVAQYNAESRDRLANGARPGSGGSEAHGSVSLSQFVDALLQPRATHDAAARLCAAAASDGELGSM